MLRRWLIGASAPLAALLLSVPPALAGGWAVTTFDQVPAAFAAGETYRLGYTIRQHGVRPFDGAKTTIHVRSASPREELFFPGSPDGTPGHYVAEVRFPAAGEWTWEVEQWPFAPQPLGTLSVAPALPAPSAEVSFWAGPAPWRLGLPVAALLALALFLARLTVWLRRRRPAAGRRAEPAGAGG